MRTRNVETHSQVTDLSNENVVWDRVRGILDDAARRVEVEFFAATKQAKASGPAYDSVLDAPPPE
jgi:hypothetical protein